MHFSHPGTSLNFASQFKSVPCFRSHSRTAISTSSLLRNRRDLSRFVLQQRFWGILLKNIYMKVQNSELTFDVEMASFIFTSEGILC